MWLLEEDWWRGAASSVVIYVKYLIEVTSLGMSGGCSALGGIDYVSMGVTSEICMYIIYLSHLDSYCL